MTLEKEQISPDISTIDPLTVKYNYTKKENLTPTYALAL
jgi:hypothetical protein